jgi:pimeloyl-ACP methyl ester carboxylesterase
MEKPRLVMIHGLLGALDCLQHLEPLITAADARTVHLLGYGNLRDAPTLGISLSAQASHVAKFIERLGSGRVWVLGHSVGGAVAMFLADQRPDLVQGVINVEGNFTLNDAFWSSRIASMTAQQWAAEFDVMRSDPSAWLRKNGIVETHKNLAWATTMLQREQPAATIHNMARAVVAETSPPAYLEMIKRVIDRGTPLHLVAGEKSAAGWDIPAWARTAAASYTELPDTGHMMMLEDPARFASTIDALVTAE